MPNYGLTSFFHAAIRPGYLVGDKKGRIAQLGEHRPYKPRVTGSSPVPPTKSIIVYSPYYGGVAQFWLERRPVKPEVAGSSPVTPAILNNQ